MGKISIWIKRTVILAFILFLGNTVSKMFGNESVITQFVYEKIVFTPYNIAGIIMICLAPFGIWFGKKGGYYLLKIISFVIAFISIPTFFSPSPSLSKLIDDLTFDHIKPIIYVIVVIIILCIVCWIIEVIRTRKILNVGNYDSVEEASNNAEDPLYINEEKECEIEREKNDVKGLLGKESNTKKEAYKPSFYYSKNELISLGICPQCGSKLVSRQNSHDKSWFKGCKSWPACNFTVDYHKFKLLKSKCQHKT